MATSEWFKVTQTLRYFYHAEIHRRSDRDFYSLLGLAIQGDTDGLAFNDLGPIYTANVPNESAKTSVELCGAPYVIRDGYFYIYSRDVMHGVLPKQVNLSVARAKVADVVRAGLAGQNAGWRKFHEGSFAEPSLGGRSTALEKGNPNVRWMDVSYNNVLRKYIMIVAANTTPRQVTMFVAWSDDGITWSDRRKFANDPGECFYPSILGFGEDQRQTGGEFYVYYTSSATGSFERWNDAVIARRKVTVSRREGAVTGAGGHWKPASVDRMRFPNHARAPDTLFYPPPHGQDRKSALRERNFAGG